MTDFPGRFLVFERLGAGSTIGEGAYVHAKLLVVDDEVAIVGSVNSNLAGGVPCAWVAGDEVYGADPQLRAAVAAAGVGFVLAVARTHPGGHGPRSTPGG